MIEWSEYPFDGITLIADYVSYDRRICMGVNHCKTETRDLKNIRVRHVRHDQTIARQDMHPNILKISPYIEFR